jgi:pantothenate kinase type III
MLLTIDVGNTNITLGLYNGNTLFAHWRLATDHARMPDEYGLQFLGLLQNAGHTKKDLTGICLASVVPQLTGRVIQACKEYLDIDSMHLQKKENILAARSQPASILPPKHFLSTLQSFRALTCNVHHPLLVVIPSMRCNPVYCSAM